MKKEVFERLAVRDVPKSVSTKPHSMDRQKQSSTETGRPGAPCTSNKKFLVSNQSRNLLATPRSTQVRKNTTQMSSTPSEALNSTKSRPTPACETLVSAEAGRQATTPASPELKMENSAVTVAVRVRPFSLR